MKVRQIFQTYDKISSGDLETYKFCPICRSACQPKMHGGQWRIACSTCHFMHFQNPSPAVSVLVMDQDRFLLGRRIPTTFAGGKWCLPCGYIEYGEDYLTAAVREVQEETGLHVKIEAILSVASNFFAAHIHTLVIILLAHPIGGEARADDDFDQVQWFGESDTLPDMAFEGDQHIIERYYRTALTGAPVDPDYAME